MKKFATIFTCAGIVMVSLFMSSCETELSLDGLETNPKLVVNSLFTSDSLWKVNVTQSRNILKDPVGKYAVENAVVSIFDQAGELITELSNLGSGNYVSRFKKPEPGKIYSLKVEAEGFETVTSKAETPYPIDIGFITKQVVEYEGKDVLKIDFEINDKEGQDNYYVWELQVNKIFTSDGEEGTNKETVEGTYIGSFDTNSDKISGNTSDLNDRIFISDMSFDGSNYSTSFYTDEMFQDIPVEEGGTDPGFTYERIIKLYAVTKDYYEHLHSLELYRNNQNSSSTIAQPVEIHSNIVNGYGIFGGYFKTYISF